jgi:hypothetical protein
LSDPAEPYDSELLAPDVGTRELHRSPGLPPAGAQETLRLAESPGRREQQHEGGVGGRLVQDVGCVGHDHVPLPGSVEVYVVVADGHVGDNLQPVSGGVHDFRVHLLGDGR